MAGPRQIVDGPSFSTLPYSLWDAVQHPAPETPHWQNGITWIDRCPDGDTLFEECIAITGTGGSPTAQLAKTSNVTQTTRGATSFTVYAEFDCAPVGLADAQSIAETELTKVENWLVERAFWTGVAGSATGPAPQITVFPHLAANTALIDPNDSTITLQTAATPLVTGGGDVAHVLGDVEAALADCYHGQGIIHITREALPTFVAWDLVEDDGNGGLFTASGNRVVVGQGYTGSSPAGEDPADGTSWIYATGAMMGYRSSILVPTLRESFTRSDNTYHLIAERTYVFGWECCHFAGLVTLGVPT
jgi:hypothetical protein